MEPEEYESIKEETVDQIKEFTTTLDRMNTGGVTLNNTFSTMKAVRMPIHCFFFFYLNFNEYFQAIRKAIATSFNTVEMIKMFGDQNISDMEKQLLDLDENYSLKRITLDEYERKKVSWAE